jgi:hypothetical protein
VRVAFVVGFFNSLEEALQPEFQREFDNGRLVFLPIPSPRHPFDFKKFKSQFFDAASRDDQDPILVVATDMRNAELAWVRGSLEGIVDSARSRSNSRPIEGPLFLRDAQNAEPVADALRKFKLGDQVEEEAVSEAMLQAHVNGGKAFCVRGRKQSCFEDALRRANIQFGRFEDYFVEVDLPYGSNVGQTLKERAKQHSFLLYAWGELKYMQPSDKDKWSAVHQGQTPADAVARFKQAVIGTSRKKDQKEEK